MQEKIQILYCPGMFGNLFRFLLDRSLPNSKLKTRTITDIFNKESNLHQPYEWSNKFSNSHQVSFTNYPHLLERYPELNKEKDTRQPDPDAEKILITFEDADEIFANRCVYYRNPLLLNNVKNKIEEIILLADQKFVIESFNNACSSKMVAKEIKKIEFHAQEHIWMKEYRRHKQDTSIYQFDVRHLFDPNTLGEELYKISKQFNLKLEIDNNFLINIIDKIINIEPVPTIDRCNQVLEAINNRKNINCEDLDIIEQAWIEVLLEKKHDSLLFPFGTNWFSNTDQINEFIDRYPSYLKHMNPRLPWYNNIKNPFYLTGKI
jgi:hypothetical protein